MTDHHAVQTDLRHISSVAEKLIWSLFLESGQHLKTIYDRKIYFQTAK